MAAKPRPREFRAFTMQEMRVDAEKPMLVGYAAVFDSETDATEMFGFREVIRPGAFSKTLKESDVRALINHDPNLLLGRSKSGTLRMVQDDFGLKIEIDPPDTTIASDIVESIRRGDMDQMSFAFEVIRETWTENEDGPALREVLEVRLYDVSVVTFPAYEDTTVGLRNRIDDVIKHAKDGVLEDGDLSWLLTIRGMLPSASADAPSGDAHAPAVPRAESVDPDLDSARRRLELVARS